MNNTQVFVFDPEKIVVEARPAHDLESTAAMDALSASDIVALRSGADDILIIGWLVTPCDRQAGLTVVARTITGQLHRGLGAMRWRLVAWSLFGSPIPLAPRSSRLG